MLAQGTMIGWSIHTLKRLCCIISPSFEFISIHLVRFYYWSISVSHLFAKDPVYCKQEWSDPKQLLWMSKDIKYWLNPAQTLLLLMNLSVSMKGEPYATLAFSCFFGNWWHHRGLKQRLLLDAMSVNKSQHLWRVFTVFCCFFFLSFFIGHHISWVLLSIIWG